jgi:tryptophanase
MFGRRNPETGEETPSEMELVRLAIPRRVYTQSHIDYVIEAVNEVYRAREEIGGLKIVHQPPFLRHFTAKLQPL